MTCGIKLVAGNGGVIFDSSDSTPPTFVLILEVVAIAANASYSKDYTGQVTNASRIAAIEIGGNYVNHHTVSLSGMVLTATPNSATTTVSYLVVSYI